MFNNIDFNILLTLFFVTVLVSVLINVALIAQSIINRTFNFLLLKYKEFWIKLLAIIGIEIIVCCLAFLPLYSQFKSDAPKIQSNYPATEAVWDSYSKPIEVKFDKPVSTYRLRPSIQPEIQGKWVWDTYLIDGLTRSGKFYPSQTLLPNTRIVVYITGIGRPLIQEDHEFGFVFDSVQLPEVILSSPFNETEDVKVENDLKLYFDKSIDTRTAEFNYAFTPAVNFTMETKNNTLILKPSEDLQQGLEYHLNVTRKAKAVDISTNNILDEQNPETIFAIKFKTVDAPLIKKFSPRGTGVLPEDVIRLTFQDNMITDSVTQKIQITPAINADYVWQNNKLLEIKPKKPLPKDTNYSVKLLAGVESSMGGKSKKDAEFTFKTIGPVLLASTSPQNSAVKVSEYSPIRITFDQKVDQASAQSKFSISPNVSGTFTWEDNTMIFKPNGSYSYSTNYRVTLNSGIKSILGLDSTQQFSFNFTTRSYEVILSGIPQYFQPQHPQSFSCNIYAAKMALAYKGYNLSIVDIIAEMGYNDKRNNNQWTGNPYKEYVGTYDGGWGYGVYWDPTKKLFTNRGISTDLNINWNIKSLAQSIDNGKPVVIWRYNGESANYNIYWTASDGTSVYGINGQHGGVIIGYRGTPDNPTAFLLNDPWYGQHWQSASNFDYYWSRLGRVGLVIK